MSREEHTRNALSRLMACIARLSETTPEEAEALFQEAIDKIWGLPRVGNIGVFGSAIRPLDSEVTNDVDFAVVPSFGGSAEIQEGVRTIFQSLTIRGIGFTESAESTSTGEKYTFEQCIEKVITYSWNGNDRFKIDIAFVKNLGFLEYTDYVEHTLMLNPPTPWRPSYTISIRDPYVMGNLEEGILRVNRICIGDVGRIQDAVVRNREAQKLLDRYHKYVARGRAIEKGYEEEIQAILRIA